jgi:hypothetical protein
LNLKCGFQPLLSKCNLCLKCDIDPIIMFRILEFHRDILSVF